MCGELHSVLERNLAIQIKVTQLLRCSFLLETHIYTGLMSDTLSACEVQFPSGVLFHPRPKSSDSTCLSNISRPS